MKRSGMWVLYIAEQVLTSLDGKIPGAECAIVPNWRVLPGQ
ncbi:hypothetical protein [Streptomyces lydicus]|nr:hypothetical protein [Streptomyces lydicus]MCZ1006391.1 hypothetical protein [Streptomyces lydicus]